MTILLWVWEKSQIVFNITIVLGGSGRRNRKCNVIEQICSPDGLTSWLYPFYYFLSYFCFIILYVCDENETKKGQTLQHWCSGNIDGGDKVFLKRCERNMWCLGRKISHYSWGAILITSLRLKIDNNHLTWKIVLLLASDCSNIFICFSIWKNIIIRLFDKVIWCTI